LLGQSAQFDQLLVKLSSRGSIGDVAEFGDELSGLAEGAERSGPLRADALNNTHPHAALMTAIAPRPGSARGLAFVCSATLAACVISLWMRREVRQVGIMKTLGARSSQLAAQYLALVTPLVLFTVALAFPIGTVIARWVVRYHEAILNIDVSDWSVPRHSFSGTHFSHGRSSAGNGSAIVRAARISPRRAIQDPGIVTPAADCL